MAEIYASLDDINANLPSMGQTSEPVVTADDDNTALLQISVARIIRAYLGRVIEPITFTEWTTPENTPEIITEIAAKLIASALYFNETAKTNVDISPDSFAQKRYDEAMELLKSIISGDITIPGVSETPVENLQLEDFFPVDATDRAFTLGMEL